MRSAYVLPLLLAGLAWAPTHAAPLYKWVDSAGQVIYSSSPPPAGTQVEKVQAPPQPSAEEVRQTGERAKKIEAQANALEAQRHQQEADEAEAARLRALQSPPAPIVIETPVYAPSRSTTRRSCGGRRNATPTSIRTRGRGLTWTTGARRNERRDCARTAALVLALPCAPF